ncbi:HlyD family type I secretion periplasmic adaptor subunit [Novispirillum itersonii]|uniref:Membrane fusion protein (MFP) family protein n=1 Tax=Novispirillum itersonii TaxID=189 RepID=A0A7X0DKQ9_NOVIT|nr:HlyD family type I secretion periplasmic adaptor subunit [Novispirillum itersonii]MBB6209175.1 HlyD family type I secretion membrane fusion protein [Novispirillum itersonii]
MPPETMIQDVMAHPVVERGRRKPRPMAHVVHLEEDIRDQRRKTILSVSAFVLAFTVWASTQPVAETAVTSGQVVVKGSVQKIQHFEGGIIRAIPVREGMRIKAGDPVAVLDPAGFEAEEGQLLARKASLELQAARLRAFASGSAFDGGASADLYMGLGQDQIAILRAQEQSLFDRRAVLQSRLEQREAEQEGILRELAATNRQIDVLTQERDVYKSLFDKGIGSRVNLLRAERELATVQAERARAMGRLETVRSAIEEARKQLTELVSVGREDAMSRLGAVTSELAEVQENLNRARDKVSRLVVRSPMDGVIKGLAVNHSGEVIAPGQLLMEIVPEDGELQVESRIATKDVGAVAVGQTVRVKVTAFDFARYGSIDGKLEQVSATTFFDEQNQPYYKAKISLAQDWVGKQHNRLIPGMVVQADVLTGEKTLIEYLLKPVYIAATQAFTER